MGAYALLPAANTDPVSYRCSWRFCGQRLVMERNGYWWTCPCGDHGSSHDPRRHGPRAWLHAALGWWARPQRNNAGQGRS